jgi:hypothetical protein
MTKHDEQNVLSVGDHPQPPRPLVRRRTPVVPNQVNPMGAKQHWAAPDRVFFVLRGLPGDGLEDRAREIALTAIKEGVSSVVIFRSEDFLRNPDGTYRFDRNSFIDAHRRNYERVVQNAVLGAEVMILANPNVKQQHYMHYVKTVNNFYYDIQTLVVGNPYDLTLERAIRLSENTATKIPPSKLMQYSSEFEPEG